MIARNNCIHSTGLLLCIAWSEWCHLPLLNLLDRSNLSLYPRNCWRCLNPWLLTLTASLSMVMLLLLLCPAMLACCGCAAALGRSVPNLVTIVTSSLESALLLRSLVLLMALLMGTLLMRTLALLVGSS